MAVVDYNANKWVNNDGLLVLYPPTVANPSKGGEFSTLDSGQHVVSVTIDLAALSTAASVASGNEVIVADNVTIPNGSLLTKVTATVLEAPVGATATLDVGLVDQDRTTEIDFDGILTNATVGALGSVTEIVKGGAGAGALVGALITNTGLITASVDTANYTDGAVKIDIEYVVPHPADL